MNIDLAILPDDTTALKGMLSSLATSHTDREKENQIKQTHIKFLEGRIRLLQNELFGRKTEKHPAPESDQHQLLLFEEVTEKLDIVPAKMEVIRHILYKYACKHCEGVDSNLNVDQIVALRREN